MALHLFTAQFALCIHVYGWLPKGYRQLRATMSIKVNLV